MTGTRRRARSFGTIERRSSATRDLAGRRAVRWLARYTGPDLEKYGRSFADKGTAEAWLATVRDQIERDLWERPLSKAETRRRAREAELAAATRTIDAYAERYLSDPDRALRPNTTREYRRLLNQTILPWFGGRAIDSISRSDLKAWRASLSPSTPSVNASSYRLLRALLNAAEADDLIERAPSVRGAATARPRREVVPATLNELVVIVDAMPARLRLLVLLAADVGLREGELLELRRSDVDGLAGAIAITRKVEKDRDRTAPGACPSCGRVVGPPKTARGRRTVHVSAPLVPVLRAHLLAHAAPGQDGLLFPGERADHMSARYLMDRFKSAREAAGRPDLTIHGLRHTALTFAGQHGATAAELQARAGHASQAAMAIYQHGTRDRDALLAEKLGATVASHPGMSAGLARWTR